MCKGGAKMKQVKPQTLSGFMELLPKEQLQFNYLREQIEKTFKQFGFLPLDTPIIEASAVLLAKAGGETEKQLYQIKKGTKDLTLRFDLTVPLAKYVAKNYGKLAFPFRRYQIGKVYRGERAQRGRFREFYQCDIDIVGVGALSLINDAEILYIMVTLFEKIKLDRYLIKINNRKLLTGFLNSLDLTQKIKKILITIDKKDKLTNEELTNSLTALELTPKVINAILDYINITGSNEEIICTLKAQAITDPLWKEGLTELITVCKYSQYFGIKTMQIDLGIARGLDYYTGTIYETFLIDYPEIGSICSGGRYDDLASHYTKYKLPGVGISIGLTRLFSELQRLKLLKTNPLMVAKILIIPLTDNNEYIINCYQTLNQRQIKTIIFTEKRSLKSIINYALELNIPYVIFIGDEEVKAKTVTIKNLKTFNQKTINLETIEEELKNESIENKN